MSDMSFKQAKEIVEKIELAELSLNKTLDDINNAGKEFHNSLQEQKRIMRLLPKTDIKLNLMRLLVGINLGFILGLIAGKYFL